MTLTQFLNTYQLALNAQQQRAVQTLDGPVLLLAVPGSGKTTVLVSRIGYMVLGRSIPPESILTMTYTVAAAQDMRQRFATLFGAEMAQRLEFRTINGVCSRIISCYERITGRKAYTLMEQTSQQSALKIIAGADGPSAVFVAWKVEPMLPVAVSAAGAVLILASLLIYRWRK